MVFFNESLQKEFYDAAKRQALTSVDLLLIFGTTLKVKPFSLITRQVPHGCPQVLINRGNADVDKGDSYSEEGANGKLFLGGDCDDIVRRMVIDLSWEDDLRGVLPEMHKDFV